MGVDEESYYEEEVGNDDEVTDDVVIGVGSEEGIYVKEELDRSGMVNDKILEYMEENFKCCFPLYLILFSNYLTPFSQVISICIFTNIN